MKGTNNRLICITGQTGSGKSALCSLLAERGLPVILSDRVAHEVVEKGSKCLDELAKEFGQQILNSDGTLNRSALAKAAFSDPEKTALLNRITHPHIMNRIRADINRLFKSGERNVVIEIPLLVESGIAGECDPIIVVTADEEIRKKRIMQRDNLTAEAAELRMKTQVPYTGKNVIVFENTGNTEKIEQFAENLIKSLTNQKDS